MKIRNTCVSLLGLKTDSEIKVSFPLQPQDNIGLFHVYDIDDKEAIFGANDKHLDFRVSLSLQHKNSISKVTAATMVQYNNFLGKAYFFVVKPFHKIIVPVMLKSVAKKLAIIEQETRVL
jgi:hypothetical protein